MSKSSIVTLGGKEYEVTRSKLREWLQLEDLREKIAKATDREDRANQIYSYLSVALSIDVDFSVLPWYEVAHAYNIAWSLNLPSIDFPLLKSIESREKAPWSYEERSWYAWSHNLAGAYGWELEYIAQLDVDDAIGLMQEISVESQLDREWDWGLSEKSVSYDKQGKGKFKELDRPDWMQGVIIDRTTQPTKIKRSLLPVGLVISWSDEPSDA